jgi:alcohol dehydrogenase
MDLNLISDMARSVALPGLKRAAGLVTRMLPIPQPTMLVGPGASARLGQAVGGFGHRRVLVVTDTVVRRLGLLAGLTDALAASGTEFRIFDGVTPDAPLAVVEAGIAVYEAEDCDALVAFGGGSVMDAAKAIGLCSANGKHPRDLVGYFRARHAPPPLYAVPTTAGTGSEVTVAAVIADPERQRKLVIADTRLVPRMAALDPCLMAGLPPHITAATGLDALTHAVEAFIGQWHTATTDRLALAAVATIFKQLPRACADGADLAAREAMALASTYAGLAFTRANVGNVHAIAHQLGARYHTPHGLANAMLLAPVLRFSASACEPRLARLAVQAGAASADMGEVEQAGRFIDAVAAMNLALGIPATLADLREADIPELAAAACHEANANYPVPRVMTQAHCETLLRQLLPQPGTTPVRKPTAKAAATRSAAKPRAKPPARPAGAGPARPRPAPRRPRTA